MKAVRSPLIRGSTGAGAGFSGILQRKCACGANKSGLGKSCEECQTSALQRKLSVGSSADSFELEADRVADQVLAGPSRPGIRGAPPRIQRFSSGSALGTFAAPPSVGRALAGGGRPLEGGLRADMEGRFGRDFSGVRIHSDDSADRSARDVDAHAYTLGKHIVFGAGQFAPATSWGRRLLAHELTHVVQQSDGGGATTHIQRQRRGAAAGCGICMMDPTGMIAGAIAHIEVQGRFAMTNPAILAERATPGVTNSSIDLSYTRREHGGRNIYIGEIKPLDDAGIQAGIGRAQLQDYARELRLSGEYDEVYRMRDDPPPGPLFFVNPFRPPGCARQQIRVQRTEPGLYQYYCEPPWSELVRRPECSCLPRLPPPVYVPVPVPQPEFRRVPFESPRDGPIGQPNPGGDKGPVHVGPPPSVTLPQWFGWKSLLALLGALLWIAGKHPLGRLAAAIGTALGLMLRALGITLGIIAATGVATAGGKPGDPTGGTPQGADKDGVPSKGGAPSGRQSSRDDPQGRDATGGADPGQTTGIDPSRKGGTLHPPAKDPGAPRAPVTVPGGGTTTAPGPAPDSKSAPGGQAAPSKGKATPDKHSPDDKTSGSPSQQSPGPAPKKSGPPAKAPPAKAPGPLSKQPATKPPPPKRVGPPPGGTTAPKTKPPTKPDPSKQKDKARGKVPVTRYKVIEGLNLQRVIVGQMVAIGFQNSKATKFLIARSKVSEGDSTTVDFESLVECSEDGKCERGGNFYTVTHPWRPIDESAPIVGTK